MATIYKKDSKGRMRFLTVKTEGSDIIQLSGLIETDNPVEHRKTAKAKNIGKSNETTPEQQAQLEAQAVLQKKLDKDYFRSKEDAENKKVLLPMLAKNYDDHKHKIDWTQPVFAQPKLDGQRCLIEVTDSGVTLWSRNGKKVSTLKHIEQAFQDLPRLVYDGELYAHGLSFQENMKLIKKYRKDETEKIKFHSYDIISPTEKFEMRYEALKVLRARFPSCIELVKTEKIYSHKDLEEAHKNFLSQGYEGTIVRWGKAPYKIKGRSENLLKYKEFKDLALTIKDIVPAEQMTHWGVPVFDWPGGENDELRAGTKLSHEEREDLLTNKNKYIGKTAELRFFEYSDEGVPRFPVMVGIRNDK